MKIKKISSKQTLEVIEKKEPIGLFYYKLKSNRYFGINNMGGNAYTKEFKKLKDCRRWLIEHERYGR